MAHGGHPATERCEKWRPVSTSVSGRRADNPVKGYNGSIWLGAINRGCAQAFGWWSTLGMCCPYVCLTWVPSNSFFLARLRIDCEWVIASMLHCEIASSGTRWLSCKPVVLVTLGGCHLLDGLVAYLCYEACKKIVQCSEEVIVRDPIGVAKSNSSRARHEGRQVVWSGQVLELMVSTPCGRVWLVSHH
jgi:hypothetical protein